jgi:hypothetical protein
LACFVSVASGQVTGFEGLAAWDNLALERTGVEARMISSYDREPADGTNRDYNYYEWPAGFQDSNLQADASIPTVIAEEIVGPGILTRFWMPHAAADEGFTVKITIDGATVINTNSNAFLDGSYLGEQYGAGGDKSPLVQTLVGGQVSYEPIAFQQSLKIESTNFGPGAWARTHHYYQYAYETLPAGTTVTPYDGSLTAAQTADRDTAIDMIGHLGSNPSASTGTVVAQGALVVPAGGATTLASLTGSGQVQRLNLKLPSGATDAQLDGLRLRVRYDGSPENAIDVPVSQFFGAGHGRTPYKSLPLGTDGPDGFYSYWPMPFRDGMVVEVVNTTGDAISLESAAVEYRAGGVAASAGYLHAVWSEETTSSGQAYHELLNIAGSGHYVGNLLYVERDGTSRTILEGDDTIIVDGVTYLLGTGLEDAYNGGYYYNHVLDQADDGDVADPESGIGPFSGLLHMDDADFGDAFFRTDQYRWLIGDCVPFTDGIQVLMENYGKGGNVFFGSTAFYYATPEPTSLALVAAGGVALLAARRRRRPAC